MYIDKIRSSLLFIPRVIYRNTKLSKISQIAFFILIGMAIGFTISYKNKFIKKYEFIYPLRKKIKPVKPPQEIKPPQETNQEPKGKQKVRDNSET